MPRRPRHAGFTLIELVASLGAMSVILVALGSTILIAGRIAPQQSDAPQVAARTARALDQFLTELSQASRITELNAAAITLEVPDRTGDASPETVRYAWGGVGRPLTRSINSAAPVTILDAVDAFALRWLAKVEPGRTGTASRTLAEHAGEPTTINNIGGPRQVAQILSPVLPDDATKWGVSRIRVYLAAPDALPDDDQLIIEIRTVEPAGTPSSTVLARASVDAGSVDDEHGFVSISGLSVDSLAPGDSIAIVLSAPDSSVGFESGLVALADPIEGLTFAATGDGGNVWNISDRLYTPFAVAGTITATSIDSTRIHAVSVELTVAGSRPFRAAARVPAAPELGS